jgi:hypothetical protein
VGKQEMAVSRHFSMAGTHGHFDAICSGDLSTVKGFLQVHPETLNAVRSPLPLLLFLPFGEGRGKGKGEGEELTTMGMPLASK